MVGSSAGRFAGSLERVDLKNAPVSTAAFAVSTLSRTDPVGVVTSLFITNVSSPTSIHIQAGHIHTAQIQTGSNLMIPVTTHHYTDK
jgi:hypothetical protein